LQKSGKQGCTTRSKHFDAIQPAFWDIKIAQQSPAHQVHPVLTLVERDHAERKGRTFLGHLQQREVIHMVLDWAFQDLYKPVLILNNGGSMQGSPSDNNSGTTSGDQVLTVRFSPLKIAISL